MITNRSLKPLLILIAYLSQVGFLSASESGLVDFRRDIRPILSDNCFACHGPDEDHREAGLRLDQAESAMESAIVTGDAESSELIARITTDDDDLLMPPAETGKRLTPDQINLLRRWIDQGAAFDGHWAFTAPQRPAIPEVGQTDWVRNPIDAFVLERIEKANLSPSPPADRVSWLRRLSLDLIGLPPSIDEVDAFLADSSRSAHATQIERLLRSPHFGERWGRIWLDAARYADSDGYEKDKPRVMWFYRDWVVRALNRDMPYDQFIIEQIAGDLLPDAKQAERVATGFLRNSMVNEEGGADPEQFRMEAMFDRMDAVGKSVLGLTIQCAQCHSHKYDPLTQRDYYRMFAFLNHTHDAIVPVYDETEKQQRDAILRRIADIESDLKESLPDWNERMVSWENSVRNSDLQWEVLHPIELPFEGQKFRVLDDSSILSESYAPTKSSPEMVVHTKSEGITGIRMELLTHPQLPLGGPGRSIRGTGALSEMSVFVAPLDKPGERTRVKIVSATADVNPEEAPQPDYCREKDKANDKRVTGPIEYAIDGKKETAWTTDNGPGRRNQSRKAVFVFEQPVGFPQGTVLTIQPQMLHGGWNSDDNQNCLMGRYRFSATTAPEPVADPLPNRVRQSLEVPPESRTQQQRDDIFRYWRTTVDQWSEANREIESLWKEHPEGTTQLVLQQRETPRETFVLDRGDFLSPVDRVEPGVPDFLHPLPDGDPSSRLTFAKWLVDDRSPTTARSIVNRIWQAYFGTGLVETTDDLGSQSTPPSHPALIDWLAVELMENEWSLKHIHRLIVSSATYRQSSFRDAESQQRDPYNRLLARGPRFRVDAEIVRDITLAASGLLDQRVGGPTVCPPAPSFLFEPPASYGPKVWDEATGADRYRRGLYTFRFRSVPYPMLETFDAVPGNVACVRRNRSNTPLQALTMLNEPLSMECARGLADVTLREGGASDRDRLIYAFRRCVSRTPAAEELATLEALLKQQQERLSRGEADAAAIVGVTSVSNTDDVQAINQRAAWTLVARVLLNLDETITKE
jgi:hypothetical protein